MEYRKITFEEVKNNLEFNTYINSGNKLLGTMGYTDHSAGHTMKVAVTAAEILKALGYEGRDIELAMIAGYIHDIGNAINRKDHAHTGAVLSFEILTRMGMHPGEIATIIGAVGNHDESTGEAISAVSAALIIADKSDVRRTRVRNNDFTTFDIHDRVNYAVEETKLEVSAGEEGAMIKLIMKIDTSICSVLDYFEIFLERMLMCKRAAEFLNASFELYANESKWL